MIDVPPAEFEELVADALDEIPDALAQLVDNVVVVVEDRFDPSMHEGGHVEANDDPDGELDEDLLGLYEGVPLTERDDYGGLVMPDRITIFRLPICALADSRDEVVHEVLVTVVHELAHHFGIEDEELHELGWG